MKIVKFEDETYGIRKGWFFGWRFLSRRGSHCWSNVYDIDLFCKYSSLEDVKKRLNSTKHEVVK